MLSASFRNTLYASALGLALVTSPSLRAESIGTSCADCPSYSAAYSITNNTGNVIKYQYRWGSQHDWKHATLQSGQVMKHTYPLGEDRHGRAPSPYVRFDNVANDGRSTMKEYHMHFNAVGYAGYGPNVDRTEPKRYYFKYAGNHLDLFAK